MDLLGLLTYPEGKTLEFKCDQSSPDGVMRSIAAFANTAGGVVLIGVGDQARVLAARKLLKDQHA
jgi:ATP-dependent DNA helicase RecG